MNFMSEEEASETWNLYPATGGYGFNRGHATSYGLLAVSRHIFGRTTLESSSPLCLTFTLKNRVISPQPEERV